MNGFPLAVTNVTQHNGVINKIKITINSKYEIGDAEKSNRMFDLQSILAHELGHALGLLEDKDNNDAVMSQDTIRGTTDKRTLHKDDIYAIKKLYR